MSGQKSELRLIFKGDTIKDGTINVYDLGNTIISLGRVLEAIANNEGLTKQSKLNIELTSLKSGSIDVNFDIVFETIKDVAATAITFYAINGENFTNSAEKIIQILLSIIKIKKFLKGEHPEKIVLDQSGNNKSKICKNNGSFIYVDNRTINNFQSPTINSKVRNIFYPLFNEASKIEKIEFQAPNQDNSKDIETVQKPEAEYFKPTSGQQIVENHKIKAVITRLDSKTGNGLLTLKEKRISFDNGGIFPAEYDQAFKLLADSLKYGAPVYITGKAFFDYNATLQRISITKAERETKLL